MLNAEGGEPTPVDTSAWGGSEDEDEEEEEEEGEELAVVTEQLEQLGA